MKQPTHLEVKQWLYDQIIIGVKVHYYQTGTDTSDTDWEIFPADGKSKRYKKATVEPLLKYDPDWVRLYSLRQEVRTEVEEWRKFVIKEAKDLAEYERLKAKFAE